MGVAEFVRFSTHSGLWHKVFCTADMPATGPSSAGLVKRWPVGCQLQLVASSSSPSRTFPLPASQAGQLADMSQPAEPTVLPVAGLFQVADFVKVDELPKKAVFCRCWRSETFPYCNGAHMKHNKVCLGIQLVYTMMLQCHCQL